MMTAHTPHHLDADIAGRSRPRRDDAGYVRPSIANDSRFGVQDQQRYVLANPFAGIKVRGAALRTALDTARGFTETEWLLVRTRLSVSAKPRGDLAERGAAIVLTYLGAPFVRRPITHGGPLRAGARPNVALRTESSATRTLLPASI